MSLVRAWVRAWVGLVASAGRCGRCDLGSGVGLGVGWAGGWCEKEWFGFYGSFCFWRVGILKGRLFDDRPFGFCVGCLGCLAA